MIVDLDRRWVLQAKCSGMPTDDFFIDHGMAQYDRPTRKVQAAWNRAKRICEDCPVLLQCARDSLGELDGVWGGLDPAQRKMLRSMNGVRIRQMEDAQKQEYAEMAYRLRKSYQYEIRDCSRIMGVSTGVITYLVAWYEDHLEQQPQAQPEIVTLELPDLPKAPWPTRQPGDRDAWVRYGTTVVPGYYRGQTEDDTWFFMKVPLSKEDSSAWFKAEDVQMRRELPRNVRQRVGNESRIYGTSLKRYSGDEVQQAG